MYPARCRAPGRGVIGHMFWRRTNAAVVACCATVSTVLPPRALADDDAWDQQTSVAVEPSREFWAGGEAFGHVWSLYTGSTYSPFGNLRQDGVRLRAVTAYSQFKYNGLRYDAAKGDAVAVDFNGQSRTSDLFVGYQASFGATTVKAFAGWQIAAHLITPFDTETIVQGRSAGPKGALEIWTNFGNQAWASLDLSYAKAFGAYSTRLRGGWRATETLSVGPEVSLIGHEESRMLRLGAFLRFDNGVDELSASAGWSQSQGDVANGYVTAQWLRRF